MNTQHPRTDKRAHTYAQCDQYTYRDRSLPNQYTQHILTMAIATDQYTATTRTPVRRDRTNLPLLPPLATYGRPYNLFRPIRSILPVLRVMLSPLVHRIPTANTHHEHRYTYQTSAAEPYVQNATAKTTTRSTSANGARHRVRTVQNKAILLCCASTNPPSNNISPRSRKSWRINHPHATGTPPGYYSDVSRNSE